jgi:glycosyltransferase involved in cell wall biosynthesis
VPGYNPRLRVLDALLLKRLSRRLWRGAAAVVAVSDHLRSLARATTTQLEIGVIRNGVDTRRFTPAGGDNPTVLFVGRLIPRKGVPFLLEAFRAVAPSHPEARLVIAGDGPERGRLEELSRRYRIEARVEFRGFLERDALPGLYHEASVFVSPALEEAMPNVVLEAMASGLPIITTHSGADEIVQDNGTLVDPGDAGALAGALGAYLADGERRRREGRRSRELADRLSWPAVAESYRELYDRILTRPARVVE